MKIRIINISAQLPSSFTPLVPSKVPLLRFSNACLHTSSSRNPYGLASSLETTPSNYRGQESWKETVHRLYQDGIPVHPATFGLLLRSFGNAKALLHGKQTHYLIIKRGVEKIPFLRSELVQMYGKCGNVEDASTMFLNWSQRNVGLWNFMMKTYGRYGQPQEAIQLFWQMYQEGLVPSKVTFVCILSAFADQIVLQEGKRVHSRIENLGFESDVLVGTALVNMYGKCGSLGDARKMFDQMPERDVVLWTAIISLYAQNGLGEEVLKLFDQMQCKGNIPDKVTIPSILDACSSQGALAEGRRIHACMLGSGIEPDIVVGNALINMYVKCGNLEDVRKVFEKMREWDIISWTGMITALVHHEQSKQALELFGQIQEERLKLDKVTFISILDACESQPALSVGKVMHVCICDYGFESDIIMGNALVNMYGKCGSLKDSRTMFDRMPRRNVVTWTAMIGVYIQFGQCKEALQLFEQMQQGGVLPNTVTLISILAGCASERALVKGKEIYGCILDLGVQIDIALGNALLNMYSKCSSVADALMIFDRIRGRDVVSWTAVIALYAQNGHNEAALNLFGQMLGDGILPDKVTFVSVLAACASQAALARGKGLHVRILNSGLGFDVVIGTALVNMYGKCGTLDDARKVFDCLPKWDLVLWNAIIAVYSQNGHGKEALQLCEQMQCEGLEPDEITFLSLLVACSHAGLVGEGCNCFTSMVQDHSLSLRVDHYVCMIDMLGRAGQLDDAELLINDMPVQPKVVSYMALLGACRCHGDIKRGEGTARRVFELASEDMTPYLILWNMYTEAGMENDAAKLIDFMNGKGLDIQVEGGALFG